MTRGSCATASALLAVLLAAFGCAGTTQAPPSEPYPQSLVGEWWGTWHHPYESGQFYMTIEKVEGNRVQGRIYATGGGRVFDVPFTGILNGNRMTYGTTTRADLLIDGDVMEGAVSSDVFFPHRLRLMKKK